MAQQIQPKCFGHLKHIINNLQLKNGATSSGSTFKKEWHKTAIFPALHKLTHICRHAYEYMHIYNIKVIPHHYFDIGGIPNGNVAEKYTSRTIMAQVCTGWPSLRGILLWQAGTARHLSQVHSISFKIRGSCSGFTQSNIGSEQVGCSQTQTRYGNSHKQMLVLPAGFEMLVLFLWLVIALSYEPNHIIVKACHRISTLWI